MIKLFLRTPTEQITEDWKIPMLHTYLEEPENNTLHTPKASLKTGLKRIQDSMKRQKFSFEPHGVIT